MLRRPALAALAIALVVPLAACTEATRIPDAEPSSAVAPLFASDEEALAAATAAYEEYLLLSNSITENPDSEIELLREATTSEYFEEVESAVQSLREQGLVTMGTTQLQSAQLQQHFQDLDGQAVVIMYACIDVSAVRVLDATGTDQTPAEREELVNLEVEFQSSVEDDNLRISRSDVWTGGSLCTS